MGKNDISCKLEILGCAVPQMLGYVQGDHDGGIVPKTHLNYDHWRMKKPETHHSRENSRDEVKTHQTANRSRDLRRAPNDQLHKCCLRCAEI